MKTSNMGIYRNIWYRGLTFGFAILPRGNNMLYKRKLSSEASANIRDTERNQLSHGYGKVEIEKLSEIT
jgi:hypothetical protein